MKRALILLAVTAGCLSPDPPSGSVRCSPNGKACPDNYYCEPVSRTCYRVGEMPGDLGSSNPPCDGGIECASPLCDVDRCANGFACGATGCLTACTQSSDCQPFFTCNAPHCERIPESDCLDGVDNNGDGKADCEDPTCAPAVTCVPAVALGGEVGLLLDSGPCPANYPTAEPYHATLEPKPCTGCTCKTSCSATVQLFTVAGCGGGAFQLTFTSPPGPNGDSSTLVCKNFTNTPYLSGTVSNPSVAGCTGGGTATQADPSWATNKVFCAAHSSATCASTTEVCVAKQASPVCARVEPGASCPAGYTTGAQGVYYSDFVRGSCSSCASCNAATTLTCAAQLFTPQVYTESNCTVASSLVDTSCGTLNRPSYKSAQLGFTSTGTDNCSSNVTSTPPSPTGGARFCCQ